MVFVNDNDWRTTQARPSAMLRWLACNWCLLPAWPGGRGAGHGPAMERRFRLLACAFYRERYASVAFTPGRPGGGGPRWRTLRELDDAEVMADGPGPSGGGRWAWSPTTHPDAAQAALASAKACVEVASRKGVPADVMCRLIRDAFPTPFTRREAPWAVGDVRAVARAAYDGRLPDASLDPARLAVLSDAAEEAGCDDAPVLDALRRPAGRVYRGLHALEACMGRP